MYRSYRVFFQGVKNPKVYWTQFSSLAYAKRKAFEKCVSSVRSDQKTYFCIESVCDGQVVRTKYYLFLDKCLYSIPDETYFTGNFSLNGHTVNFNERGAIADKD